LIIFDLEFYVPPEDRNPPDNLGSLIFNPIHPSHKLLGGSFLLLDPLINKIRASHNLWFWNMHNNERDLLERIIEIFTQEWTYQQQEKIHIPHHSIIDALTCGFSIARIDLPVLFVRSQQYGCRNPSLLYDLFLKTKVIDLSDVASFLFPEDILLYPKTFEEVSNRLGLNEEKKISGKVVWDWYDTGQLNRIETRCQQEVKMIYQIYLQIRSNISSKMSLNN
jgi:hypothetical protein